MGDLTLGGAAMRAWAAGGVLLGILATGTARPEEPPAWANDLRLVAHGGPVAADVEITINGQFVLLVQDEPRWFHEIADLVKPGINEVGITLKKSDEARSERDDLSVSIHSVKQTKRAVEASGTPLVEMYVPADAGAEPACTKSMRFWAGPPSQPPPTDLKNQYWLYVTGPAAQVSVAVFVNGQFVYEASEGNAWFDATAFVKKGKNDVVFETKPTCLVRPSTRSGSLVVGIAPAKLEGDRVSMTEPPQAEVEVNPKRDKTGTTIRRSFRAW